LSDRILAPAYGTRNDIFRSVLKGQAQESGKPDCYFAGELCLHPYDRKPKDILLGHVYRVWGLSIFKELTKGLHQDPALLIEQTEAEWCRRNVVWQLEEGDSGK
jgi:hypothetical protein